MKQLAVFLSAIALGATAWAAGQQQQPGSSPSASPQTQIQQFRALDKNSDGVIDAKEAKKESKLESSFSQADANGDGNLDMQEYLAHTTNPRRGSMSDPDY